MRPDDVTRLHAILKPTRVRYDLGAVMDRWSARVRELHPDCQDQNVSATPEEFEALTALLINAPPGRRRRARIKQPIKRRPRMDLERFAALMLGVIFSEYTGRPPTRISDAYRGTDNNSPFYQFARAAFKAIGLKPSPQAFREVCERWNCSDQFDKANIEQLLWGALSPRNVIGSASKK